MTIRKPYRSFVIWPLCFAGGSLVLTYVGWLFFNPSFWGTVQDWIPESLAAIFIWVCLWPSLLLEVIGIQTAEQSVGFIPNAIGWGAIDIIPAYMRYKKRLHNNADAQVSSEGTPSDEQ